MSLVELSYVGLHGADLDSWSALADSILRVEVVNGDKTIRLRTDSRSFRIAIHELAQSTNGGLSYMGWEMRSEQALREAKDRLTAMNAEIAELTDEEMSARAVRRGVKTSDPDGYGIELTYAPTHRLDTRGAHDKQPAGSVSTYDLGHVVIGVTDLEVSLDFYMDGLGLNLTDLYDGRIAFLHCNDRHHSLALVETPEPGLRHVMLETPEMSDLGIVYDRCLQDGIATRGLGQHVNDEAVTFYCSTPSEFLLEFAWGSLRIDEAEWTPRLLEGPMSFWGHPHL